MFRLQWLLFFMVCLLSNASFAQSQMQVAKIKQRLITELKIDNKKADSVVNIVQDFYTHARAIRTNTQLKDEERKASLQTNRKAEMVRLRTQLNTEQIQKLQQVLQEMRQEKQNRKPSGKDSASLQ